jgi:hypothetical protein
MPPADQPGLGPVSQASGSPDGQMNWPSAADGFFANLSANSRHGGHTDRRNQRLLATVVATASPRRPPAAGGIADRNQGHGDSQRITRPIITIRRAKRCLLADCEWRP